MCSLIRIGLMHFRELQRQEFIKEKKKLHTQTSLVLTSIFNTVYWNVKSEQDLRMRTMRNTASQYLFFSSSSNCKAFQEMLSSSLEMNSWPYRTFTKHAAQVRLAVCIIKDCAHPAEHLFVTLPSGRRYAVADNQTDDHLQARQLNSQQFFIYTSYT